MNRATSTLQPPTGRHLVTSVVTLALWRWRQHWFLLLMTGLGMIAAVIIACAVPLLSQTMLTAGLRGVLRASPTSSEITLGARVGGLSTQGIEQIYQDVKQPLGQHLGTYVNSSPRLDIETPIFDLPSPGHLGRPDQMSIYGTSMDEAASHLTLVQGQLPRASSSGVEIAITPAMALPLQLHIGSVILLNWTIASLPDTLPGFSQQFSMRVVGIFNVKPGDPYWHGYNFLPASSDKTPTQYTVLASEQDLLAALDRIAASHHLPQVFFIPRSFLTWYYHLDPSRISIDQLDDLMSRLNAAQAAITTSFSDPYMVHTPPYIESVALSGAVFPQPGIPSSLQRFRDQLAVVRIPVTILAVQVLALILFFVGLMAILLVDRQADAIAVLRSRGASRRQVFGAFLAQGVSLGLVALVLGPPLAIVTVYFVAQRLLPVANQDAFNVISNAPVQALLNVKWYALAAVIAAVLAMCLALYRASRADAWTTGSEAKHERRRPLWRRFNLDLVAVLFALAAYGISLYLAGIEQLLDAKTQTLVISPLALLAPVFLLLAAVLLFLRVFPLLLQLGSGLVLRGRGAAPMLALAQMARAPRQALRMILLLALAIAFAIFTLVFAASQTQRASDIADYQVGADFSGAIPLGLVNSSPLQQEIALYRHIQGVLSATGGYVEDDTSATKAAAFPVQLQAVDPATYAQATLWPTQDAPLLAQLAARRTAATQSGVLAAIVDAPTAGALNLHVGSSFSLYKPEAPGVTMHYIVIALVPHIAMIGSTSAEGSAIVDYQSFAAVQLRQNTTYIFVNHIWLHTRGDAAALASVRAALSTLPLQLDGLSDRRALIDSLRNDPLSLSLVGLLAVGTTAALLLALAGSLLTSWLSVRRRLTNFTVLRTLGAAPQQIVSVLTWEQGIIYATTLVLGIVLGVLLTVTAVPTLVFSVPPIDTAATVASNNAWFALQHAIPLQLVAPAALGIAFVALVIICIVALTLMVRVVLQSSISKVLRLDENQSSEFLLREDAMIGRSKSQQGVSQPRGRSGPSVVTLALWQLRQVRLLWLVQGIGMIAAVAIVCVVPLFSTVTNTAELYDVLTAAPAISEITLDVTTQGLSTNVMRSVQHQADSLFQQYLGNYLDRTTPFSIQTSGLTLLSPMPANSKDEVQFISASVEQAAPYLRLVQGRLPQSTVNGAIETLLTPVTAQHLHVTLGSLITVRGDFFTNPRDMFGGTTPSGILKLRVVGLFNLIPGNAAFWHGESFEPTETNQVFSSPLLVPNEALLTALDQLAAAAHADTVFSPETFELLWRYHLDTAKVAVNQVDQLISNLTILRSSSANKYSNVQNDEMQPDGALSAPYLVLVNVYNPAAGSYDLPTTLDQFRNRTAAVAVPIAILSLQIFGLILFFVGLIANLLVDRQADSIAILRSRGASNSQIFGALFTQSISLGVIALVVGPLLAAIVVSFIALRMLGAVGQEALPFSIGPIAQSAVAAGWYALGTVLVVMIVMFFLLRRAAGMNVLLVRREAARATRRPLWQRLNLDVVAALLALIGYGVSLYLASISNLFDARTKALVAAPLTLVAPVFLLIGALLLFLRFFSALLRLGERLAVRGRGMISMLALAQMARSPRQAIRMTLLLALAIAFAIFTLVFASSQSQRISDIAAYESGADFSGDIPLAAQHLTVQGETAKYSTISGVTSVTVGYTGTGVTAGTAPTLPLQIRAVDARTFAHTAIWTPQYSSQSLTSLMAQLVARHGAAANVPVIVDAVTMNTLGLQVNDSFTLSVDNLPYSTLNCMVIAEVQHIPTINNSDTVGSSAQPGGVLLDYTTFATDYAQNILANRYVADPYLPINHAWLRTAGDTAQLSHVRAALTTPDLRLDHLYDRQVLIATMHNDPLYLNLIIILVVGAATALLLTLVGDLIASWLGVRTRVTNFAVLRSLGATSGQVTRVLLWEQVIVYIAALLLGVVFGVVLSATAVPTLSFSSTPAGGVLGNISNDEFFAIQHIIPTQIIVPLSLGLAFIALVAVCVFALGTMVGVVVLPSMSQALRLNED